jgi:hypothetical protein
MDGKDGFVKAMEQRAMEQWAIEKRELS